MAVRNYIPVRYDNTRLFYIVEAVTEMTNALGANGDIALHVPSGEEWTKRGGVWVSTGRRFGADLLTQAEGLINAFVEAAIVAMGEQADEVRANLLVKAEEEITEKFDQKTNEAYNAFVNSLDAELNSRMEGMVNQVTDLIDRAIAQADINGMIQGNINQAIQQAVDSSTVLDEKINEKVEELAPVYIEANLSTALGLAKADLDAHAAVKNQELDAKLPVMLNELQTFIEAQTVAIQESKIVWKGNYSSTMQYVSRDVVYYLGSAWIATGTTLGTPPPTLPATTNSRWQIFVRQGDRAVIEFANAETLEAGTSTTASVNPYTYKLVTDKLIRAAIQDIEGYIDEVQEFPNMSAFPMPGASGKLYVATSTNRVYRWSGSQYIEISSNIGTTDALVEGTTNRYFTEARSRSTTLFGLVTTNKTEVVATDTMVVAIGKLQAQLKDIPALIGFMSKAVYDPGNVGGDVFNAANMRTGVFNAARIPDLPTSKITGLADFIENWIAAHGGLGAGYIAPFIASFKGNGVQTVFNIPIENLGEDVTKEALAVYVDGIYQSKANFTFNSQTGDVTFSEAPPTALAQGSEEAADNIEIVVMSAGKEAGGGAGIPAATPEQADQGTSNTVAITPLTAKYLLDKRLTEEAATKEQGIKADTALQPAQATSMFASKAAEDKANSALQPADVGKVATTNNYNDLDNLPGPARVDDPDMSILKPASLGEAGVATLGLFPLDAMEELALRYAPGNIEKHYPRVEAPIQRQGIISFPDIGRTVGLNTPTELPTSNACVFPIAGVSTNTVSSPLHEVVFEPASYVGLAVKSFRYMGQYPLFTSLTGNLEFILNVGANANPRFKSYLYLEMANGPAWERGENNGRQLISSFSFAGATETLTFTEDYAYITMGVGDGTTTTFSATLNSAAVPTTVTVSSVIGTAAASATDNGSGLLTGNPAGEVDYTAGGTVSVTFNAPPASGRPVYLRWLPRVAVDGNWARHRMNVNQRVNFWPGADYYLRLLVINDKDGPTISLNKYGLRVDSGGLSFVYDGSSNIKKSAAILTNLGE